MVNAMERARPVGSVGETALRAGSFQSVRYLACGEAPDAASDLVVFLPGAAGRAEHWMPQLLSGTWDPGYCLVAVDYPGSGDRASVSAAGCAGVTTTSHAKFLWGLVASLTVPADARIHLVGLSFGGMVAQKMAAQKPKAVASVILVNTYGGFVHGVRPFPFCIIGLLWLVLCALTLCRLDRAGSDLNEAWVLWGAPAWRMPLDNWERVAADLARGSTPKTRRAPLELAKEWVQRRVGDVSFVIAVLTHSLGAEEATSVLGVASRVVVASEGDWLVRPGNAKHLAGIINGKLVRYPDRGHLLQLEAPAELTSALQLWCAVGQ